MPGLDNTGPMGQGAQTGRKRGKCRGGNDSNEETTLQGRGLGRGFRNRQNSETSAGMGRRRGNGQGRGFGRKTNMQ